LITKANEAESYLLCANRQSRPCPDGSSAIPYFAPYSVRKNGGLLSNDAQATLKRIVLEPSNYSVFQSLGEIKPCIVEFDTGYVLTVRSARSDGIERIVLSMCHGCSVLSIRHRGSTILLNIDYAKDQMLELTRALFPKDAKIEEMYLRLRTDRDGGTR
jgi:hypothetical protein